MQMEAGQMIEGARIAYFSMEIALESDITTYSGGLGVLAGDTLRSFADLTAPVVAVTLVHRKGYFSQRLGRHGSQRALDDRWDPALRLEELDARVRVAIEGHEVEIGAWRYRIAGEGGAVDVVLLDSDRRANRAADRRITDHLYGGDERCRLRQEAVLGIGGLRMLRALGCDRLEHLHLNEGHAALAALEALAQRDAAPPRSAAARTRRFAGLRPRCVFTTHTPVPAGHDRFPAALARRVLGDGPMRWLRALGLSRGLDMTKLALAASGYVNAVALRHAEVSRRMFPGARVDAITNGVHAPTWVTPPFAKLFDRHVPAWRADPLALRQAVGIPLAEVGRAHRRAQRELLERLHARGHTQFSRAAFTIGFARRATAYKRATLLFRDEDRLAALARAQGPLQVVLAGKAHPRDREGRAAIRTLFRARDRLRGRVAVAYLEGYDMELARAMCGGVDLWLNTPVPPLEASGTSGMKAALNGVPSLSILDGWWVEGCVAGVTGWPIGHDEGPTAPRRGRDARDAAALYDALEQQVLPCYRAGGDAYCGVMRSAIALNGAYFNTTRMALEYLQRAYRLPPGHLIG